MAGQSELQRWNLSPAEGGAAGPHGGPRGGPRGVPHGAGGAGELWLLLEDLGVKQAEAHRTLGATPEDLLKNMVASKCRPPASPPSRPLTQLRPPRAPGSLDTGARARMRVCACSVHCARQLPQQ